MRLWRAFFVGSNLEVQSGKSGGPTLFRNNRAVSVCVCVRWGEWALKIHGCASCVRVQINIFACIPYSPLHALCERERERKKKIKKEHAFC